MKLGILIETNEPEKAWNATRLANAALKKGHAVKIFLMSAGVEAPTLDAEPYSAKAQFEAFTFAGGLVQACGTCLNSRDQGKSEVCPRSTMADCLEMVEWADKLLTF